MYFYTENPSKRKLNTSSILLSSMFDAHPHSQITITTPISIPNQNAHTLSISQTSNPRSSCTSWTPKSSIPNFQSQSPPKSNLLTQIWISHLLKTALIPIWNIPIFCYPVSDLYSSSPFPISCPIPILISQATIPMTNPKFKNKQTDIQSES